MGRGDMCYGENSGRCHEVGDLLHLFGGDELYASQLVGEVGVSHNPQLGGEDVFYHEAAV